MVLEAPGTCSTSRAPLRRVRAWQARCRKNLSGIGETLREAMRLAQPTVGELSEPMKAETASTGIRVVAKVHCSQAAAISTSELVILPWGFWTSAVTHAGHFSLQTMAGMCRVQGNQTPPAPQLLASQKPRMWGRGGGTNSQT